MIRCRPHCLHRNDEQKTDALGLFLDFSHKICVVPRKTLATGWEMRIMNIHQQRGTVLSFFSEQEAVRGPSSLTDFPALTFSFKKR